MIGLAVPKCLLVRFPGFGVGKRCCVGKHGDAFATLRGMCQQFLGDAVAFTTKYQVIAIAIVALGIRAARFFGQEVQALIIGRKLILTQEVLPALIRAHVEVFPIAKARAVHSLMVERESQGAN